VAVGWEERAVALRPSEFAVVDCETTGLHPRAHHRIIELAVVTFDDAWEPTEVWCTLLSPQRDLGPTDIHGIRGRDVRDAPAFDEVLGEILDRLAGRIVAAHNARFDSAFLEHELARLDMDLAPLPTLCTMELAGRLGLGSGQRRLADCCTAVGVAASDAHSAEGDALACAALLAACIRSAEAESVAALVQGRPLPLADWPKSDRRAPCKPRKPLEVDAQEPDFLAKLVQGLEMRPGIDASLVAPYLDVLDRAIEDRRLSTAEQDELAAVAMTLGLNADRVRKLHGDYVGTLVALARRDGVVTDRERADLCLVAEALGIAGISDLLDRPFDRGAGSTAEAGVAGKSVCFTGALTCHHEGELVTRELAQELAEGAGMVVAPRVTKKLDMLVVADPDSLSGKARKAREYGVRVVAESAFWSMIGVEVS
jgi:DNA polymerase III subunit epsilon